MDRNTTMRFEGFVVYRMYDEEDTLLYVGASCQIFQRMICHSYCSPWRAYVARVTFSAHNTLNEMLEAEKKIIETEGPIYNREHSLTGCLESSYNESRRSHGLFVANGKSEMPEHATMILRRTEIERWLDVESGRQG